MMDYVQTRVQILRCRNCSLCEVGSGPVPFVGKGDERLLVVGEAPGAVENEQRRPFVGPSGQVVRKWLTEAGMNPLDCGYMNVVSCYPCRTPTGKEVEACAPNVTAQMNLLRPSYVLVLGGVALSALCPVKTRITEAAGFFFRPRWNGALQTSVWAMATYHPAATLRNPNLADKAIEDVMTMVMTAREEMEPAEHYWCMKCKVRDVERVHECGMGFCNDCWRLACP